MSAKSPVKVEQRWHGLSVSEGIARGRVLRIHTGAQNVYRATLGIKEIEPERARLRTAVELARCQLQAIKERAEREIGAEHGYIFDAHLLLLEDRKLFTGVEEYIERERVNAEWAVKVVFDRILAIYGEIKDDYLRERGSDIEDIARRILAALGGDNSQPKELDTVGHRLTEDAIIVAEDLLPSATAELDFGHVKAIVSDTGGWTSHTAIIARGIGIPAVLGLRDLYRRSRTGDEILVDAFSGEVILHPSETTRKSFGTGRVDTTPLLNSDLSSEKGDLSEEGIPNLRTLDGVEVILRANVELPVEYENVRRSGARGIGLYRSEFLLSQHGQIPSEDEQFIAYLEIAKLAGADGATIRLFDLGGEKVGLHGSDSERNPALGLRAIRLGLSHEEIFRPQVRALMRAAAHGSLSVVVPMISDISDVRRARSIIDEERQRLESEGYETGLVKIGAMIEVPAIVLMAERLAREVDFFSLGTNDLVQYLLGVDRSNDRVAGWFRSLHPAVLQSIQRSLLAARNAGIPAVVCGEMAARPAYAAILVGLGALELSMTASAISRVWHAISGIYAERARTLATECLECATADDVEELVRERLGAEYPHLFPSQSLPAKKRIY